MAKAGILIVEDSYIVAYHLKKTLESEGYHVFAILDSGEELLQFLETTQPDLVLMDIMLNGQLDGIQTASIIKTKYNLPVIYITALSDKETIQRAKVTEPYGYLTKPFEDREIFTVLEMALYKHDIETQLKKSEAKYAATVNSISDVLILLDDTYTITYINPAGVKLINVPMESVLGLSVFDFLQLRNEETKEFPVNPLQCQLPGEGNAIPDKLVWLTDNREIPIGEGSISAITDKGGSQMGLVLIFKDLTEKVEHAKLLRDFENTRIAALIEGQEKERSRIAKDLHDGLGQMLNAIKMNVSVLVDDPEKERDIAKLLDEAIQESIRISENLLPSKLKDFDLSTCLKSLCKQIHDTVHAPVSFQQIGDIPEITQNQKVNFYRIAQEAVSNAIRHSKPSNIVVQVSASNNCVKLVVEDNGRGIRPVQDGRPHHGLVNMRERAEMMGGKLVIESDEHRGTFVLAEVPLT